jgi:hypothetical protein
MIPQMTGSGPDGPSYSSALFRVRSLLQYLLPGQIAASRILLFLDSSRQGRGPASREAAPATIQGGGTQMGQG